MELCRQACIEQDPKSCWRLTAEIGARDVPRFIFCNLDFRGGAASYTFTELVPQNPQSAAINRRSRCGSMRGWPVASWHRSPWLAPQVGQRTASICLESGSLFISK